MEILNYSLEKIMDTLVEHAREGFRARPSDNLEFDYFPTIVSYFQTFQKDNTFIEREIIYPSMSNVSINPVAHVTTSLGYSTDDETHPRFNR